MPHSTKIVWPAEFVEAFERTGLEWCEESANTILSLLASTASGRTVASRIVLPHFARFLETEMLRTDDYPAAPEVEFSGMTVTLISGAGVATDTPPPERKSA